MKRGCRKEEDLSEVSLMLPTFVSSNILTIRWAQNATDDDGVFMIRSTPFLCMISYG